MSVQTNSWLGFAVGSAAVLLARAASAQPSDGIASAALSTSWQATTDVASAIWQFEAFQLAERPITVGTIVGAIALFSLGALASRRLSLVFLRLLTRRLGLDAGVAVSYQGLAYYFLLATFLLLALKTLHVPLTAFTVLGGGLAIGVGFGSQNIVNNFISGLILMIERPIRMGDIVEVDGTYGRVEHIGARSTWIKTFDNIHIIVPNSSFLEKNVINWTHSDNVVRTSVEIGVAYGSATREVERSILHALDEHGRVLDKPAPAVLFTEFGDNALVFRAYFWLNMPEMIDRRRVESDVRHQIYGLFGEAGIEIAFPQRDVHLDAATPIPVELVT